MQPFEEFYEKSYKQKLYYQQIIMKQTSTLITTLLLLLITSFSSQAFSTSGKKNLFDGYIISNQGDTTFGKIQFVNPVYNEMKVRFFNKKGRKRVVYKPNEILEYAFLLPNFNKETKSTDLKWIHYFRKRVEVMPTESSYRIKTLFLQRITEGKLNVYNYYTLSSSKINNREYERQYFIEQMTPDGFNLTYINRVNYRDSVRELLASNEALAKKLGKRGYGYKYLPRLVSLHNRMMNGEKVII